MDAGRYNDWASRDGFDWRLSRDDRGVDCFSSGPEQPRQQDIGMTSWQEPICERLAWTLAGC